MIRSRWARAVLSLAVVLGSARAWAAAGDLDPTFGVAGRVVTDVGAVAIARAVAVQPDGRIVVAGTSGAFDDRQVLVARYLADGSLDGSFGTGGVVQLRPPGTFTAEAYAVALQGDGGIVVAGDARSGTTTIIRRALLVRLLSDGTPDPGFGGAGIVLTPHGAAATAQALAIQPDGRLVVAGSARQPSFEIDSLLMRHLADGSLDASFGVAGIVVHSFDPVLEFLGALALQPDGALVVAGGVGTAGTLLLARFDDSGDLDGAFGTRGAVRSPTLPSATALARQPDGKLLVVGNRPALPDVGYVLARFDSGGAPDSGFGVGGRVVSNPYPAPFPGINALALESNGRIILAGTEITLGIPPSTTTDLFVARRLPDGGPDPEIPARSHDLGGPNEQGVAVARQADGRVIVAGGFQNRVEAEIAGPLGLVRIETAGCGDGAVVAPEACDDGNFASGDGCDLNCTVTACGNGIVTAGETCDDGDTVDEDGCCSATCQAAPPFTPCLDDGNQCTADVCDPGGSCSHLGAPPTLGVPCEDGNPCTQDDRCVLSACEPGPGCGACERCDPGEGCVGAPATTCEVADAAKLTLSNKPGVGVDKLKLSWKGPGGAGYPDPTTTADYRLCAYDGAGSAPAVVLDAEMPAGGVCAGRPCWKASGTSGFTYKDRDATPDGIESVSLRGKHGRASITLKGKGQPQPLGLPPLPLSTPVRVQLRAEGGACWDVSWAGAGIRRNDATTFSARLP